MFYEDTLQRSKDFANLVLQPVAMFLECIVCPISASLSDTGHSLNLTFNHKKIHILLTTSLGIATS